jgi:hypothetical protein
MSSKIALFVSRIVFTSTARRSGARPEPMPSATSIDARLGGHLGRRDEQCRLADAGLARQQQRRAIDDGLVEKRLEGRQLAISTNEAVDIGHLADAMRPQATASAKSQPLRWPGSSRTSRSSPPLSAYSAAASRPR